MIVYCAGAIKGDITFQKFYKEIIYIVKKYDHVAISELNREVKEFESLPDKEIYDRDIKWLDESDVMIAEVSGPSLGVGYEIAYALHIKKIPVLALLNSKAERVSSVIAGCNEELLRFTIYNNLDDLKSTIKDFLIKHGGII